MAVGIIIHVSVGAEKRTEIFTDKNVRIGSTEQNDLQIHHRKIDAPGVWLDLEASGDLYRVVNFDQSLNLLHNGKPVRRFAALADGDTIEIPDASVSFSFFALESKSSLITTNRDLPHVAPFIETAAMESGFSPKRDDAKVLAIIPMH